ncbi:unnamed protein product [Adineta ricciae]|uniref:Uncharacterized protein n=1 Tax=Adineta ricciae TaxID=249248 RepID=A0A813MLT4_ADIRI|nr:unnamed protein product [Adineta ricciae]
MKYPTFSCVVILSLLFIHLSTTIGSLQRQYGREISMESGLDLDHSKWYRETKIAKKDKSRSRALMYDFLLHKWFLRKVPH